VASRHVQQLVVRGVRLHRLWRWNLLVHMVTTEQQFVTDKISSHDGRTKIIFNMSVKDSRSLSDILKLLLRTW